MRPAVGVVVYCCICLLSYLQRSAAEVKTRVLKDNACLHSLCARPHKGSAVNCAGTCYLVESSHIWLASAFDAPRHWKIIQWSLSKPLLGPPSTPALAMVKERSRPLWKKTDVVVHRDWSQFQSPGKQTAFVPGTRSKRQTLVLQV